ncbi:MAG TPA: ATP-binding cassette domain-containing protein [Gaiella sp.]|nr:ATP-binding cassette domain-containing protein [Gaiella sp.]
MVVALWRPACWVATAIAAMLVGPRLAPADPTLYPLGEALAAGVLSGAALFYALGRRRLPAGLTMLPGRRLAARSVVLAAKSAQEEAIWRAFVLGLLMAPLSPLGALVVSTALFALAHVPRQGRAASAHALTGSVFGAVYLATGRLVAAIAAHGAYNILVGASTLADETLSVSDTGTRRCGVLASGSLSRRLEPMHERVPTPLPPLARLESATKAFGDVMALAGVDLEVRRGEIVALLGPNGAGKSTAVAILLGLRQPDAGRALLFCKDPRAPAARRHVGAVLQEIGYPPAIRVREVVDLVRAHFDDPESTESTLARLDLEALADRDAIGLSGGQRRRLAVALALAGRPQVVFLDEPTAGMDATARRALLADIVAFAEAGGAVLLTTQQLAEAEEIATRVVLLVEGRVALEGTVAEMRARAGLTRVTFRAPTLPPLPGVETADALNGRHVLYVANADRLVAELVRSGVAFEELEVAPASLEDAFVALTKEGGM